ncbi:MAG TPA: class I SAM-dependent methyltransferase [Puia sp.]|nr:class I SAM-dependent methyltransferase [Puia sp.]
MIFRAANPGLIIPPDYLLYETYRLDYEQFFKDGEATAKEIMDWTKIYISGELSGILDWGCGISRVATHVHKFTDAETSVYACDINARMIEFGKNHYPDISYSIIPYTPPTTYDSSSFDLVYALSVFTHIEATQQNLWIKEIHRILKDKAVFLFTTHGKFYDPKLLEPEKQFLDQNGFFTKSYSKKGHRMMTTYNSAGSFRSQLQPYFEILEFHDGASDPTRTGGQDLWIVRKRAPGQPVEIGV